MNRRNFLKYTALGTAAMTLPGCMGLYRTGKQPNVILVMTDDQGYGDIGAHGSPYVKTPILDQLYQESVRLKNFHVDPCCSPTRASLLTGTYSSRTGVWHTIGGRSLLQKDKVTMADIFGTNGYRTGVFGKWHLGENYPFRPQDRGFQETLVHGGGAIGNNPDYWGNDYNDDTYYHNGKPEKYQGYCNTVWFDEAIKFIQSNRRQPFFCYISTNVPHAPLIVDEKYAEPYRSKVSDRLANYYGMITRFDEDMAKLVKEIKNLGLEENTILIYMSDNGPCPWFGGIIIDDDGFTEEGYNCDMRGGKIWGYEGAHRVPCYIRWPDGGIGGGKDVKKLTAHFDLLPTLIDCCGLKKPHEVSFDGMRLKPLLFNPQDEWPDRTLFVHNHRVECPLKYKEYQVLTERWRLVKRENEELYDINVDPGQKENIAAAHPEVVKALHQEYEQWWENVSRDFDKYNEIIIGSDRENPTMLYSHDAHRKKRDRIWVLNVEKDGEYDIKLFRWPKEANKTISENRNGDKMFAVNQARLKIGSFDEAVKVTAEMFYAKFTVHLKAGTTCLQSWFVENESDRTITANYVSVERIGSADPIAAGKYRGSDPDSILKD